MKKLLLILIITVVTQLIFVNKGADFGNSISDIDQKITRLKSENQKLEVRVTSLTSCLEIAKMVDEEIKTNDLTVSANADSDVSVALRR